MVDESGYTIGELAREAGVTPRTIRYYTTEGLLPQPGSRGRYARYSQEHLQRLRQIVQLKEHYLPLHIIRERLMSSDVRTTESSASNSTASSPSHVQDVRPSLHPPPAPATKNSTAAELLAGQTTPPLMSGGWQDAQPLQVGHYQFFPDLPEPRDISEADVAQPERWQRLILAPGVELHVREPISPERRRRLASVIAAARDQLRTDA